MNKQFLPYLIALFFSILLTNTANSSSLDVISEYEGVKEYRLQNGMQILLKPSSTTEQVIVNLVYRHGSKHDPAGKEQINHIFEHYQLLNSEKKYRALKKVDASLRYIAKGLTTADFSYYRSKLNHQEHLLSVLDWESQRLATFQDDAELLAKAIEEVNQEAAEDKKNSSLVAFKSVLSEAMQNSVYQHAFDDKEHSTQSISLQDLRALWQRHYQPRYATLVIIGNFDLDQVRQTIADKFARLENREDSAIANSMQSQLQDLRKQRSGSAALPNTSSELWFSYQAPALTDHAYAYAELLCAMFEPKYAESRWQRSLKLSRLSLNSQCYIFPLQSQSVISFKLKPLNQASLVKLSKFFDQFEKKFASGINQADLHEAKAYKRDYYAELEKDPLRFAEALAPFIAANDWKKFYQLRDQLAASTLADTITNIRPWLNQSGRKLHYSPSQ